MMGSEYRYPGWFEPDDDLPTVAECCECGEDLRVGDDAWRIAGEYYCERCMREHKEVLDYKD